MNVNRDTLREALNRTSPMFQRLFTTGLANRPRETIHPSTIDESNPMLRSQGLDPEVAARHPTAAPPVTVPLARSGSAVLSAFLSDGQEDETPNEYGLGGRNNNDPSPGDENPPSALDDDDLNDDHDRSRRPMFKTTTNVHDVPHATAAAPRSSSILNPRDSSHRDLVSQFNIKMPVWKPRTPHLNTDTTDYDFTTKLAFTTKEKMDFKRDATTGILTKFTYVDPTKLVATSENSGHLSQLDRALGQVSHHLTMYGWHYLFNIENTELSRDGRGLTRSYPAITLPMTARHGYKNLDESKIMNFVRWLIVFKNYSTDAERALVSTELKQSYSFVLASCDKELAIKIQDHLFSQPDLYDQEFDYNGPMALFLILQQITITNASQIFNLTNQLRNMDLRKFPGENISEFTKQCRCILNQISSDQHMHYEFYEVLRNHLKKCSVQEFIFSIEMFHTNNEFHKVKHDILDYLKFADETYTNLVHNNQWLPTTKSKTAFSATSDKSTKTYSKDGTKTKFVRPAWQTTAPGKGEPARKAHPTTPDTTIYWCQTCGYWNLTHGTKTHRSRKEIAESKVSGQANNAMADSDSKPSKRISKKSKSKGILKSSPETTINNEVKARIKFSDGSADVFNDSD